MSISHGLKAALAAVLLVGPGSIAKAGVDPQPAPVARVAILGSSQGGTFRTQSISVSVGFGTEMGGVTYGDATSGAIGTAVGNGRLVVTRPSGQDQGNPFETIICNPSCAPLTPPH